MILDQVKVKMLLDITAKRQLRHIIDKHIDDILNGQDIELKKDQLYSDVLVLLNIGGDIIDRRH